MRKMKIYLDTSLISHLSAEDTPEKMNDTLLFWKEIVIGKYDVHISNVVLDEISECPEPKQSILLEYLGQVDYKLYDEITILPPSMLLEGDEKDD